MVCVLCVCVFVCFVCVVCVLCVIVCVFVCVFVCFCVCVCVCFFVFVLCVCVFCVCVFLYFFVCVLVCVFCVLFFVCCFFFVFFHFEKHETRKMKRNPSERDSVTGDTGLPTKVVNLETLKVAKKKRGHRRVTERREDSSFCHANGHPKKNRSSNPNSTNTNDTCCTPR